MASASLPAGDASFRQLLSFVRLHSKAILEQFAPDDFCFTHDRTVSELWMSFNLQAFKKRGSAAA